MIDIHSVGIFSVWVFLKGSSEQLTLNYGLFSGVADVQWAKIIENVL